LTAQEALSNYLRAVRGGRTEEAYRYLSSTDKINQTLEDYRAANSLGNGLIAQMLGRHISFVIEKVEETRGQATAVVAITAPDFKLMLQAIFHEFAPERLPEQSLPSMTFICRQISHFLDKYQQDILPMKTSSETFTLLRESDGWKLDQDSQMSQNK